MPFYRHISDGRRGELLRLRAGDVIRYSFSGGFQDVPFRPQDWRQEAENAQLTPMQVTQIAYAADAVLSRYADGQDKYRGEWLNVPSEVRIGLGKTGPATSNTLRLQLWAAIMETLRGGNGVS